MNYGEDEQVALHSVESEADIHAVQSVASRLWPAGWHPGGLGWALARGELADDVVVFDGGGTVLGWAGRGGHDDGELLAQVEPACASVADALVDWFVASPAGELHIEVYDGDTAVGPALRRAGFTPGPQPRSVGMFRAAEGPEPPAPPGYTVRSVRGDEAQARVDVHRAAWRRSRSSRIATCLATSTRCTFSV